MKQLIEALADMGMESNDDMCRMFQEYMDQILEWNEKVNLTSITEPDEFILKHYIDSAAIGAFSQMENANNIIDVGTGAGFPGIPLAILFPAKKFILMDSLNKRIKIIREIAENVGIKNVEFIHGRAEELGRNKLYREQFDLCVSRAVANLAVLSEYCLPFVKAGGWFAPYKTGTSADEIRESEKAVKILGGGEIEIHPLAIKGYELDHRILMIRKISKTPTKYPRKAGTPAKEPLK